MVGLVTVRGEFLTECSVSLGARASCALARPRDPKTLCQWAHARACVRVRHALAREAKLLCGCCEDRARSVTIGVLSGVHHHGDPNGRHYRQRVSGRERERTVNNYALANDLIGNGALDNWTGKVLGVAQAMADKALVWDASRASGKGGFIGTSKVADLVAEHNPDLTELKNFAGQVSKIAKGLMEWGGYVVGASDTDRESEARTFARTYTLNMISDMLYPKSDKGRTLAAIVASMFTEATAEKNGYSIEEILAEVLAQAEGVTED